MEPIEVGDVFFWHNSGIRAPVVRVNGDEIFVAYLGREFLYSKRIVLGGRLITIEKPQAPEPIVQPEEDEKVIVYLCVYRVNSTGAIRSFTHHDENTFNNMLRTQSVSNTILKKKKLKV